MLTLQLLRENIVVHLHDLGFDIKSKAQAAKSKYSNFCPWRDTIKKVK